MEAAKQVSLRRAFGQGFGSALWVLPLWFIIRLGGLAPFPPESALVSFLSVIPESVQEPAVQTLGEAAGLLGIAVAAVIAAAVYGVFAAAYQRYMANRELRPFRLSSLENALIFALVPWVFFGVVVLPLTGESLFGLQANIASPTVSLLFPLTTLLVQLLWSVLLWGRLSPRPSLPRTVAAAGQSGPTDTARRAFIERTLVLAGSAILVLAGVGTAVGTLVSEGGLLSEGAPAIAPGSPINPGDAPAIFSDPRLSALVDSEVTGNDSFYRVSIDTFDPNIAATDWSLEVGGLVASPKGYGLGDLRRLPKSEEYSTFICVSNELNGGLIGNAKWGGVKLSDLFADVGGFSSDATYVVFHSVDGYSVGIPIAKALEPESMLAYEMNDADLPPRHGYPLRAVVPGLYGMMSAKWVRQVELTDAVYPGYWQTRGWSYDATVQTASFIRIPSDGASVSLSQNGESVIIGGVAYAGDRGISKVEVSVDGGKTWEQATLKPPASKQSWVLWAFEWTPPRAGAYTVYARATDGNDQTQTSVQAGSFPSGATGYVMSTLTVVA